MKIRVRNLLELAIYKYIKDNTNGNGVCIASIARDTGIGRSTTKDIVFKLVGEQKVDIKPGKTEKNYSTWFFFEKPMR
jgi:predicted transcriptional regulator